MENGFQISEVELYSLSVRSKNILQKVRINSKQNLIDYFLEHNHFFKIQNCGKKSNDELVSLCQQILAVDENYPNQVVVENNAIIFWEKLDNTNKNYLEIFYRNEFERLSIRSKNCLLDLEKRTPWHTFIFYPFDFLSVKNFGLKCNDEIKEFREAFITSSFQFFELADNQKKLYSFIANILFKFEIKSNINISRYDACVDPNGEILSFAFLKSFIENENIYSPLYKAIFKSIFYTDAEISNLSNFAITKERVRQIKIQIIKEYRSSLNYIINSNHFSGTKYFNIESDSIIKVDNNFVEHINVIEKTSFNSIFYFLYYSSFFRNDLFSIGSIKHISSIGYYSSEIEGLYLVDAELAKIIDFKLFEETVFEILKSDVINIHFQEFLTQLGIFELNVGVAKILKLLLQEEFDLVVDNNNVITRNVSSKRKLVDIVYEIIDKIQEPVNIQKILKLLNSDSYGLDIDIDVLRNTVLRYPQYFIAFGRTSTYGLRKWEKEKVDIKGGTIRGIVTEYLIEAAKPCHIYDITIHVKKYRKDTNQTSILRNLEADQNNTFKILKGNYIGLSLMRYSEDQIQFKKLNGVHFTRKCLIKYSGMMLDLFIKEYQNLYGYSTSQMQSIIQEKENNGMIKIAQDKIWII